MNMKGSLPLLILTILARGPSHGYQIVKSIREKSGGVLDFREGTLYPALHSLEAQGLIEGYEAVESGRTRRRYRLTERGSAALEKGQQEWQDYVRCVNLVLEGSAT